MLREMLLALKLIHWHGKVHLDIKPENIFVKDQLFKLGDFGLVIDETTVGEVEEGNCRYLLYSTCVWIFFQGIIVI